VTGSYEHEHSHSGSLTGGECLDQPNNNFSLIKAERNVILRSGISAESVVILNINCPTSNEIHKMTLLVKQ